MAEVSQFAFPGPRSAVLEMKRWQLVFQFKPLVERDVLTVDEAVQVAKTHYFAFKARMLPEGADPGVR